MTRPAVFLEIAHPSDHILSVFSSRLVDFLKFLFAEHHGGILYITSAIGFRIVYTITFQNGKKLNVKLGERYGNHVLFDISDEDDYTITYWITVHAMTEGSLLRAYMLTESYDTLDTFIDAIEAEEPIDRYQLVDFLLKFVDSKYTKKENNHG
jgi:hypothetical protein